MHPILTKNASIQGILRLQTHDSLVGIELKSLGGTFSIGAFLHFQGKSVKSYRVSCRVIVCRVGAIVCIVRVILCRVEFRRLCNKEPVGKTKVQENVIMILHK